MPTVADTKRGCGHLSDPESDEPLAGDAIAKTRTGDIGKGHKRHRDHPSRRKAARVSNDVIKVSDDESSGSARHPADGGVEYGSGMPNGSTENTTEENDSGKPVRSMENDDKGKEKSLVSAGKTTNESMGYDGSTPGVSTENNDEGKTKCLVSSGNVAGQGVGYNGDMPASSTENDDKLKLINELVEKARLLQIERGLRSDPRSWEGDPPFPPELERHALTSDEYYAKERAREEYEMQKWQVECTREMYAKQAKDEPLSTKVRGVLDTYAKRDEEKEAKCERIIAQNKKVKEELFQAKDEVLELKTKVKELEAKDKHNAASKKLPAKAPQPGLLQSIRNGSTAKDELLAKERIAYEERLSTMREELEAKDEYMAAQLKAKDDYLSSEHQIKDAHLAKVCSAKDKRLESMQEVLKNKDEYTTTALKAKEDENKALGAKLSNAIKQRNAIVKEKTRRLLFSEPAKSTPYGELSPSNLRSQIARTTNALISYQTFSRRAATLAAMR